MRLCWLTDIHLNFLNQEELSRFLDELEVTAPEAVLISGDIGESHDVVRYLRALEERLRAPIFFVLGNHDYYFGSIVETTREIKQLCAESKYLVWLDHAQPAQLNDGITVVGHGSWADGRFGDYHRSEVELNDFELIDEFAGRGKAERLFIMQRLAEEAAEHLEQVLPKGLELSDHVICVTHVPPFAEACLHDDRVSDDFWLPYYSCQIVGEVLKRIMEEYPSKSLTVLCGHTHSGGVVRPTENIQVVSGAVSYGAPAIQYLPEWREVFR